MGSPLPAHYEPGEVGCQVCYLEGHLLHPYSELDIQKAMVLRKFACLTYQVQTESRELWLQILSTNISSDADIPIAIGPNQFVLGPQSGHSVEGSAA